MSLADAHVATRLPAVDLDRARAWYSEKLGLDPVEERPGGLRYLAGGIEFVVFASTGRSDGSFTQMAYTVTDLRAEVAELKSRGVVFEEYDDPGWRTVESILRVEGQYPSKGTAELAAFFRDSEGNLFGIGQVV